MVAIDYREGCTGKQGYETRGLANQAGRHMGRRGRKLFSYECEHCRQWHLTSLKPEDHRRMVERQKHADPCDLRTPPRKVLDVSDHKIVELDRRVHALEGRVTSLTRTLERIVAMGLNLSQLIVDINDNTNAVAARLDKLAADIAAAKGGAVTDVQLAELQTISDHLKALGSDPNNPVPSPPPVATAPTASTPPADSTPAADTSSTPVATTGGTSDPATPPAPADASSSTPTT
jgi:hypothetical protein